MKAVCKLPNTFLTFMGNTTAKIPLVILLICTVTLFLSCTKNDDNPNSTTSNSGSIEEVLTQTDFQGYAIITKNGTDVVRRGFGAANENTALQQDPELGYRIGSVSKTLTAAALVQLKRDGLLSSFDQTLDTFDAEFPKGDQIAIKHLLSHQSGIPEYQLIVEQAYEEGLVLDETDIYGVIEDLVSENGLYFTPGSNKQYCNSNYLIAALLVEQLSGMPYHDYIQEKIFNPLVMINSHRGSDVIDPNTHAQGYLNGSAHSTYPMSIPFGAGDFSSTPADMELWTNAVKTDWFTTAEKEEIFAADVPSGYTEFGLGWFTTQEGSTTLFWHGGDINGFWSMIGFIPELDTTIVLLSNRQDDSGTQRNTIIQYVLSSTFNSSY